MKGFYRKIVEIRRGELVSWQELKWFVLHIEESIQFLRISTRLNPLTKAGEITFITPQFTGRKFMPDLSSSSNHIRSLYSPTETVRAPMGWGPLTETSADTDHFEVEDKNCHVSELWYFQFIHQN